MKKYYGYDEDTARKLWVPESAMSVSHAASADTAAAANSATTAAGATKLNTPRNIELTGPLFGGPVLFDGSADIEIPIQGFSPWLCFPVGVEFPLLDAASKPPTDDARFRYVVLQAGLGGSGGYNEGVLINETVSGSDPLIVASAEVNLPGSPFHGIRVELISSNRTFLRPGSGQGAIVNSQNQLHNHTGYTDTAPDHAHSVGMSISSVDLATSASPNRYSIGTGLTSTTSAGAHYHSLSIGYSGSDEARPRYAPRLFMLRLK